MNAERATNNLNLVCLHGLTANDESGFSQRYEAQSASAARLLVCLEARSLGA